MRNQLNFVHKLQLGKVLLSFSRSIFFVLSSTPLKHAQRRDCIKWLGYRFRKLKSPEKCPFESLPKYLQSGYIESNRQHLFHNANFIAFYRHAFNNIKSIPTPGDSSKSTEIFHKMQIFALYQLEQEHTQREANYRNYLCVPLNLRRRLANPTKNSQMQLNMSHRILDSYSDETESDKNA